MPLLPRQTRFLSDFAPEWVSDDVKYAQLQAGDSLATTATPPGPSFLDSAVGFLKNLLRPAAPAVVQPVAPEPSSLPLILGVVGLGALAYFAFRR